MRSQKGSRKIVVGAAEYRWKATGNDGYILISIWPTNNIGPYIHSTVRYHQTWIAYSVGWWSSAFNQIIVTSWVIKRIIEHVISAHGYDPQVQGNELNLGSIDGVINWVDAVRRGQSMTEEEWLACKDRRDMFSCIEGKTSSRKMRLFVVACCRSIWEGLHDVRSRTAVEVSEQFADGMVSIDALSKANQAAYEAVDDCIALHPFSEDQAVAAYLSATVVVVEIDSDTNATEQDGVALHAIDYAIDKSLSESDLPEAIAETGRQQAVLLREIVGNPFRPAVVDPAWLTSTITALAQQMYDSRDFSAMPILADALEDAGCDNADILSHCRGPGTHVRGCWVVDAVLGRK